MAEIPKQEHFFWLFEDNLPDGGAIFELSDFIPEYETRNRKTLSVFVMAGADKENRVGDFLFSVWNVHNLNQLREDLGTDSEKWKGRRFKITVHSDSHKFVLEPLN